MSSPRVSVLVPTYNYARYLPEAIESVLAQDFDDFEVLIADDCSADDSTQVIRRYAAQDRRIRYHSHSPNLGMVANWNWCLAQARGEYIKYVFGDDCLTAPHALRKMVAMLDAQPSAVLAVSARRILNEQSHPVELWDHLPDSGVQDGHGVILRCLAEDKNLIGEPTAVMFRRALAGRGFNPRYRQLVDLEMWFHLLERGNLLYTPEPLCAFRRHPLQQTEVNKKTRVGQHEGLQLLMDYIAKPWVQESALLRSILFLHIYHIRKSRQNDPEFMDLARTLLRHLGANWYTAFWLRRRMTQPFVNLNHSIQKRRRPGATPDKARIPTA